MGSATGWAKYRNEMGNMPKENLKAKSLGPKKRSAKVVIPSPAHVSPPPFDHQQKQLPNLQLQLNIPQQSPWVDKSGFDMFPLAQFVTIINLTAQRNEPYRHQSAYHNVDEDTGRLICSAGVSTPSVLQLQHNPVLLLIG